MNNGVVIIGAEMRWIRAEQKELINKLCIPYFKNIGQNLADLNTVIRPQLTVIDATRILLRNGPQGGSPYDVKVKDTVIASTDPVAADAYATTLFDLKPEEIESTVAAYQMGLGEMNLSKVDIISV